MLRYALPLLVLIISIALSVSTTAGQETEQITLVESDTEIVFPSSLVFKIKAQSQANITRVRLQYRVEKMNYADVISEAWPDFIPSPKVEARWNWDMRRATLPVGAVVHYWWIIENQRGNRMVTDEYTLEFQDTRYSWQNLTEGQISLFWYRGNLSFASELLATCRQVLERLYLDIGVRLERPVSIYIYGSSQDLRSAMIFPREWIGGVTFTEFGTIAIGVPVNQLNSGKKAIAHELGHMVVHQVTFSPYGASLPVWLNEGLAMYAEGEKDIYLELLLRKAATEEKLFSVRSLASPFSARPEDAYLSYAQSQSLVEFLIKDYGKAKMLELLHLLKEGSSVDEALLTVYGFDQSGLDRLWKEYIKSKAKATSSLGTMSSVEDKKSSLSPKLLPALLANRCPMGLEAGTK